MAINEITQTITELPEPPSTSDPVNFDERADAYLKAEKNMSVELESFRGQLNTFKDETNTFGVELTNTVQSIADAAQNSENNANEFANSAQDSADIALSAANYKGDWLSDYTDGYAQNDSITYSDGFNYVSKVNNNTTEPTSKVNTAEWYYINTNKAVIQKPTITAPLNGSTDVDIATAIVGSEYLTESNYNGIKTSDIVEIATDVDFAEIVYSGSSPASGLSPSTVYYARLKYESDGHLSDWSDVVSYTTKDAGITAPSITSPTDGDVDLGKNVEVLASDYEPFGHDEVQQSASWQFSTDADFTEIAVESIDDTTNLTSWVSSDLSENTTYYIRVKYKSESYESEWSESISITTKDSFIVPMQPAGALGFGVAPCSEDFTTLGLEELEGTNDINSDDWGNYKHTDSGSIMVYVPKFFYRVGSSDSPNYDAYGTNALDIVGTDTFANESEANDAGYILHRAFIDAGVEKGGFFTDKYICSKDADLTMGISIKNADPIGLTTNTDYNDSLEMANCDGYLYDSVTLARVRGYGFNVTPYYIYGALALLSVAHAQASTDTTNCAWFDDTDTTNYPKGCNSSLADVDDDSVTFTSAGDAGTADKPLTGSASDLAKTTHNGQNSGIVDLNGAIYEMALGLTNVGDGETASDAIATDDIYILKTSTALKDLTAGWNGDNDAWGDDTHLSTLYDKVTASHALGSTTGTVYWGSGSNAVFSDSASGVDRDLCGFLPKNNDSTDDTGTNQFGNDYLYRYNRENMFARCGGYWSYAASAGLFCRSFTSCRSGGDYSCSFRVSAYV